MAKKKPTPKTSEPAKTKPSADRVVKSVEKPTLSAHVPTAPKKFKPQYASFRSSRKSLTNPRRVRGGVKLKLKPDETPESWVTQRLLRVAEEGAQGSIYKEGLEYARAGQTKRFTLEGILCEGVIQGRSDKPYTTTLALEHFEPQAHDQIVDAMADQVRYAAKMLAGELPSNIEDLFAPLGLRLFPTEPSDITTECSCPDWSEEEPWCKHAVCLTSILAERLGAEPMQIFGLHAMPGQDLIDALRHKRAAGVQGPGPAPVLVAHVPGVTDTPSAPLDHDLDTFWSVGDDLDALDTPIEPPSVPCVLLRRLGPSPFVGRFPIVGLLQTCYELIAAEMIESSERDIIDGQAEVNNEPDA